METNLLREALGAALRSASSQAYSKWFDPRSREGPSGYRDAPRPFVLRWRDGGVDLILFRTNEPADEIEQAVDTATKQITGAHIRLERMPMLRLPLGGTDASGNLRLAFVTPTELKGKGKILVEPDFLCLVELLGERVRMLGRLYQNWPEEVRFCSLLERQEK